MRKLDITGQRYGRLIAKNVMAGRPGSKRYWMCLCDCGVEVVVQQSKLRSGHTKSCGCLKREADQARRDEANLTDMPEYWVWGAMIARCTNSRCKHFKNYGGRGIGVCERWIGRGGFLNFLEDMGERPTSSHTLERLNNNLGYAPENCAWRTRAEQSRNTRRTRRLTHQGRTMSLADWAKELGIKATTLVQRLNRSGWTVEKTLGTPVAK